MCQLILISCEKKTDQFKLVVECVVATMIEKIDTSLQTPENCLSWRLVLTRIQSLGMIE